MICVGLTSSGKTHAFSHIFSNIYQHFSYGICFSSTIDLNDDYQFLPEECKFKQYRPEYVNAIMKKQYNYIMKNREKPNYVRKHAFIILDDCIGQIDFHHSLFNELFSKSRHMDISIFVLIQHMNALSPVMRINSVYTLITKIKANNITALYELVSCFSSQQELKEFLNQYCKDYNCIIFDDKDPYTIEPTKIVKFPKEKPIFKFNF